MGSTAAPGRRGRVRSPGRRLTIVPAAPNGERSTSRFYAAAGVPRAHVLVVDNEDSFTGSLVDYLRRLGCSVVWVRDDTLVGAPLPPADGILLSPGPGRPEDRPANAQVYAHATVPVFGVCLGMQALAAWAGGRVVRAARPVHGRTSLVHHRDAGVFAGLPSPLRATRYHSLVAAPEDLPPTLEVTAWTRTGEIMGLRHRERPYEGVQFHPEAVRTQHGLALLDAFVRRLGVPPTDRPAAGEPPPRAG